MAWCLVKYRDNFTLLSAAHEAWQILFVSTYDCIRPVDNYGDALGIQYHNLLIANKSTENIAEFKYLG
jgi:hypothetical protein